MEMKEQTLGAFLQCHKNPYATYKCLESFRKYYPTSTIVLLSDNGYDYTEMAKFFDCIYIHEHENILFIYEFYYEHMDLSHNTWGLIRRFKTAMSLIKEEYIIWLEDDVSVNQKITDTFRYDLNGFCPNSLNSITIEKMKDKYPFLDANKKYSFTGHGGSVFHVANMLKYFENKEVIENLMSQWKNYHLCSNICQDLFFSIVIHLNQGTIGNYEGHYDCSYYNPQITVQHQYKMFYKAPLPEELQHLCSTATTRQESR
jgi:hypothetical protein